MDLIITDKKRLKELFVEAYEAGWYGSKELADSVADELVKKASDASGVKIPDAVNWDGSMGTYKHFVTDAIEPLSTDSIEELTERVDVIREFRYTADPPPALETVDNDGMVHTWEVSIGFDDDGVED